MPLNLKDNRTRLMIGGGLVLLVVVVLIALFLMRKKTPGQIAKAESNIQPEIQPQLVTPTQPQLVTPGQLPEDGKPFVVLSAALGLYLADNGVLTSDIANAKRFTYNSSIGSTNELIGVANVSTGYPVKLIINFSGDKALIGSTYSAENGAVYFGIYYTPSSASSPATWGFATVGLNPGAALSGYYSEYGVKFYYV